jgi:hypothetical protein
MSGLYAAGIVAAGGLLELAILVGLVRQLRAGIRARRLSELQSRVDALEDARAQAYRYATRRRP